jgi:hypothetical protein
MRPLVDGLVGNDGVDPQSPEDLFHPVALELHKV